jgi:ubiquinol-cytochrome c reductase cytochrome c1 subunit
MMKKTMRASLKSLLATGVLVSGVSTAALAAGDAPRIDHQTWSFKGFKGKYDKNQLQRGFQVYQTVCSSCHGMNRISFRNLVQPGGPEFPEEAVKALAASWPNKITDGPNEAGEMFERPAKLSDRILGPHKNEQAARAAFGGALPPDLSVMAKARNTEFHGPWYKHPGSMIGDIVSSYQEGGPNYIHALMLGYVEPPAYLRDDKGHLVLANAADTADKTKKAERCVTVSHEEGKPDTCNKLGDGMNYNKAYPGYQIAMGQPLGDGVVTYDKGADGKPVAPETQDQYARDVSAYLAWAADPSLNERKALGWSVFIYLLITTGLLYLAKRRVWSKVGH